MKPLLIRFKTNGLNNVENYELYEVSEEQLARLNAPNINKKNSTLIYGRDARKRDSAHDLDQGNLGSEIFYAVSDAFQRYRFEVKFIHTIEGETAIEVPADRSVGNKTTAPEILIRPRFSKDIRKPDPEHSPNFYELLKELDTCLADLAEHLRQINDPIRFNAQLKIAKASAEAMRCYLDIENVNAPEEIPGEDVANLIDRLKKVEWTKVSDQANKWVQTILKILKALG